MHTCPRRCHCFVCVCDLVYYYTLFFFIVHLIRVSIFTLQHFCPSLRSLQSIVQYIWMFWELGTVCTHTTVSVSVCVCLCIAAWHWTRLLRWSVISLAQFYSVTCTSSDKFIRALADRLVRPLSALHRVSAIHMSITTTTTTTTKHTHSQNIQLQLCTMSQLMRQVDLFATSHRLLYLKPSTHAHSR